MKLVIFGLTVSSSWGNGHATLWRGLLKSLARRGHKVTFFERDVPYYALHRDLEQAEGFDLVFYREWEEVREFARKAIHGCDAALVTSYCPDARAACDLVLSAKVLKVFYDLDTPVTLERLQRDEDVEYIPRGGLGPFDLVLSYTGGKALDQLRDRLGARRVAALYGSVDPSLHKPVRRSSRYSSDLSYLGTYASDRQPALQELFLEPARRFPKKKFLIGGALYPDGFPWRDNVWFVRHVPPPEHPAFYSSSALTLSVTRAAMAEMGYCPSGRLFEAAACGTPVVSDTWAGLETFFQPGKEIFTVTSAADVAHVLSLEAGQLRDVAEQARQRALDEHTSDHRGATLLRELEAAA